MADQLRALGPRELEVLELARGVRQVSTEAAARAWERLDSLTKPPRSLGRLEETAARISTAQGSIAPSVDDAAVVVMAGDHGVVAEGVSAWPSEVTLQMVANFSAGGAAVNQLARLERMRLVVVDVGVAGDTSHLPGVVQATVRRGTANMALGPAMTREEAAEAILVGARLAQELAADGVRAIAVGEMGIGNTTAASACTSVLTGLPVEDVVGRGTGIDEMGLARKRLVISRALDVNQPRRDDPLGVLAAVGGLELAGMAGVVLGSAVAGVCAVADGFISGASALAMVRFCPACAGYVFPSHLSAEPGHQAVLRALDLDPVLDLDMRLGEGTGAVLAVGIMRAACAVMSGMATFEEAGVSERDQR